MGTNYVRNREYEQERLMASAANGTSNAIGSGYTVVEGIYYKWNDQGFTGQGWMHEIAGSPTNLYPDFSDDDDVESYVLAHGNLDDVFKHWANVYTLTDWHNFYTAVGVESGCMDVIHGQA